MQKSIDKLSKLENILLVPPLKLIAGVACIIGVVCILYFPYLFFHFWLNSKHLKYIDDRVIETLDGRGIYLADAKELFQMKDGELICLMYWWDPESGKDATFDFSALRANGFSEKDLPALGWLADPMYDYGQRNIMKFTQKRNLQRIGKMRWYPDRKVTLVSGLDRDGCYESSLTFRLKRQGDNYTVEVIYDLKL